MILNISGQLKEPKGTTIPNGFNYNKYLKYHKINYCMYADNIEIVKGNSSVLYYLKNKLIKRIDNIDDSGYLRTFILGDKTILDNDTIKSYQKNGISHLFSISGMHVSLIVGIIMFILNKVSYNNFYKNSVIILILLLYLFLTGFGASILRTVIMFIVFSINKTFNLKMKRIDLMLIVLIVSIFINPFIICDMGFQFSYIISFTLVVFYKKITKITKGWQKSLYISFVCFIVSFPICVYNFSSVNFLSIFLNIIMIPIVSFFVFPLTIIVFLMPIIYPIYRTIIFTFEEISLLISNIEFLTLILKRPSLFLILIYYISIYLSLWKVKYLILFIIIIFFHKFWLLFDNSVLVTTIDVGQGDSIFLKMPNDNGNILIDTGGIVDINIDSWKSSKLSSSLAKEKIIPYIKSLGINHLDYLIITHGDYDHIGEAINLVSNFKVNNVIFNSDSYNELEIELIKILESKNIKYYKGLKELNIGSDKLYFLNTKEYGNENDNSNVIYFKLNNYKFLFMGDAGITREKDILDKYNLTDIDFIKIGHHGSNTSSSEYFIDSIKPKNCLISVGKNNRYGHPKESVLNILDEYCNIYRTDINGSIEIKISKNNYKIKTYSP